MKEQKQGTVKTKTSKQMSEKEQIREICDKVELRFP